MREKDVMKENEANSPCSKIYFLIQCMYLAREPKIYFDTYFLHIQQIQKAAPTTALHFMKINDMIIAGHYYKALKEARELIKYEQELIQNAAEKQPAE